MILSHNIPLCTHDQFRETSSLLKATNLLLSPGSRGFIYTRPFTASIFVPHNPRISSQFRQATQSQEQNTWRQIQSTRGPKSAYKGLSEALRFLSIEHVWPGMSGDVFKFLVPVILRPRQFGACQIYFHF